MRVDEAGNIKMTKKDAAWVVRLARDWLEAKKEAEAIKGHPRMNDRDWKMLYQRKENKEEQMAHIAGILNELRMMYNYRTSNDMFQGAKKLLRMKTNER